MEFMDEHSMRKMANAMIIDARHAALKGTNQELEEIRQWIHGAKVIWDFDTTCSIARVDPVKLRNEITIRLMARDRVTR